MLKSGVLPRFFFEYQFLMKTYEKRVKMPEIEMAE